MSAQPARLQPAKKSAWHFSGIWFGSSSIPPEKERTGTCSRNGPVGTCLLLSVRQPRGWSGVPARESIPGEAGGTLVAHRAVGGSTQKCLPALK